MTREKEARKGIKRDEMLDRESQNEKETKRGRKSKSEVNESFVITWKNGRVS